MYRWKGRKQTAKPTDGSEVKSKVGNGPLKFNLLIFFLWVARVMNDLPVARLPNFRAVCLFNGVATFDLCLLRFG